MKVFKITFNNDEEAREEEFEIRDNMGSLVDTAINRNIVYITGPKAAVIADNWYKGRNVEEIEMTESQFNRILNPKNSIMKITEALQILEAENVKVKKSPEQIARRRWRAKVRRAQKKAPELMAKLEKMYDRVIDFDRDLEAPWISRALANKDYESVKKEKERINELYKNEVAEPFDKMADDLYRAIDHDKNSELFKLLSKLCRKLEGIQFFHSGACPETDEMRRINYV